MPPLTQPDVIGWLLLFVPGFIALGLVSYLGPSASRRSQLGWIAYSVLFSLASEIAARVSVDPWTGSFFYLPSHPVRRAALLILVALIGAGAYLLITGTATVRTLRWRIFGESAEPRVWTAFFRNPAAQEFVRIELINGQAFIAHVDLFSTDVADPPRELVLTNLRLEQDGGWVGFLGTLYIDSSQIRSVLRVENPNDLLAATDVLGGPPKPA